MKSPRLTLALLISVTLVSFSMPVAAQEPADKPHVVLVVGTLHYSPELTMPVFAKELERLGFRTTVVMGEGNPEKKTDDVLPNIEALADADLAIFFMRFLKLPDDEWKPIEDYLKSGKPVIGLRTANHSFKYPRNHPRFKWNDDFGRRALGTPYIVHQISTTEISVVEDAAKHPIMTNVTKSNWVSQGTLYLTKLQAGCIPLVTGFGKGRVRTLKKSFGVIEVKEEETDVVAWAWENEWGGKVFGTSFGHPSDFAEASFVRMLVNAVHWSLDRPLPAAATKLTTWDIERADKKKGKAKTEKKKLPKPPAKSTPTPAAKPVPVTGAQSISPLQSDFNNHVVAFTNQAWLETQTLDPQDKPAQVGSPKSNPIIEPGGHIAIIGNTFADQLRINGYLETLLLQHTSSDPLSIRNLGWAGDTLDVRDRPRGFPIEDKTLRDHETDVIIACFGMGESFQGQQKIGEFKQQLQALIKSHEGQQYNGESDVQLVLVSPIAYENHGALTPAQQKRNEELKAYTQAMSEVAATAEVPFVDLYTTSRYLMNDLESPKLTSNGIHLTAYGYWAMSHSFFSQLTTDSGADRQSWQLKIDAVNNRQSARGVEISNVMEDERGIRFEVNETTFPSLAAPTDQVLPPQLELARDKLVVENLAAGTYQLTVDSKDVVTATAKQWAQGVKLDQSPLHLEFEAYRRRINDKNQQFVYSWKALNQVHIVGERRRSPSGRALPKEVIEFNEIAKQIDASLNAGVKLKKRQWRLNWVPPK